MKTRLKILLIFSLLSFVVLPFSSVAAKEPPTKEKTIKKITIEQIVIINQENGNKVYSPPRKDYYLDYFHKDAVKKTRKVNPQLIFLKDDRLLSCDEDNSRVHY
jgi:hypothetical protein